MAKKKNLKKDRKKKLAARRRGMARFEREPKMSEALLDVAGPLIEQAHGDEDDIESIVALAAVVWNLRRLPVDQQEEMRKKILDPGVHDGNANSLAQTRDDVALLEDRCRTLYPHFHRMVFSYDFTYEDGDFRLNVVSMPLRTPPTNR
jgi:hypothetical protein